MINKRWITLPVVYSRPFTSKAFFWTVNGELKFIQNRSKNRFEAKGRLYTTGKVIQRLFIIDLYTSLAIYRYRWGKR